MGRADFMRLLDRTTSQENLEADWGAILQLCDLIRQQDIRAKDAVSLIKKKICERNPHVAKFGLMVMEAVVKNCGNPVHVEIATREFMDTLRDMSKNSPEQVREKSLELIQAWSHAFRNDSRYKIIQETYNQMKYEGYDFPPIKESDAMFSAENAPEWAEGADCYLCRVKFSTFNRQHHCRACGQVFCGRCSSRSSNIPKFGIEKEVRVCDTCFKELNPKSGESTKLSSSPTPGSKTTDDESIENDLPAEYLNSPLAKEAQVPPKKTAKELQEEEEEELQLAMALSMSLNEPKTSSRSDTSTSRNSSSSPYSSSLHSDSSTKTPRGPSSMYSSVVDALVTDSLENDSEMARYMNRSYWEERRNAGERTSSPSAPTAVNSAPITSSLSPEVNGEMKNGDDGSDALISTFQRSIEMFTERMRSVTAKGKHIAMDSTVQTLFQSITAMHPKIVKLMEDHEEDKAKYQALLDKLQLLVEARNSLQSLRSQHQEKVRQQELEQDMLRRMQMEQKLELLRQQKQEYLLYQQQLQLQRQQEMEQKAILMQQSMVAQGMLYNNPAGVGYVQQIPGTVPQYQPPVAAQQYSSYQQEYEAPPPTLTQPPAMDQPPTYNSSTGYPAGPQPPSQPGQYQQPPASTPQQYQQPQGTTQPYQPQENMPPNPPQYGQLPQGQQQYPKPPSPPQQQYVAPPTVQSGTSPQQQLPQGQVPVSTSAPSYQTAQQYPTPAGYQQPSQYSQEQTQTGYQQSPPSVAQQYQPPPPSTSNPPYQSLPADTSTQSYQQQPPAAPSQQYQSLPPETSSQSYQAPPPAATSQQYQPTGQTAQPYQPQSINPPQYQPQIQPGNPPQHYQPTQQQFPPQGAPPPQNYQPPTNYDQYQAPSQSHMRDVELISFD